MINLGSVSWSCISVPFIIRLRQNDGCFPAWGSGLVQAGTGSSCALRSACCPQVLTRFLGSSSPVLYWFSAHLLQQHEPLLWVEGTDNQPAAPHSEKPLLGKSPGSCGKGTSENPVLRLLTNCGLITALSKWILGFFLSYWLLGLILHCNFLPWT